MIPISTNTPIRSTEIQDSQLPVNQELYIRILNIFNVSIPEESKESLQELCFNAVWKACESSDWRFLKKIQDSISTLTDLSGRSVFFKYIEEGNVPKVEEILNQSCDLVNILSAEKVEYSLHEAAKYNRKDVFNCVYEGGYGGIDKKNIDGFTPIHIAIMEESLDVLQEIWDVEEKNVIGSNYNYREGTLNALSFAAYHGKKRAFDFLMSTMKLSDSLSKTLLHLMVRTNNLEMLKHLLTEHYEKTLSLLESKESDDKTPLILAVFLDWEDIAVFLIEKGAYVNAQDNEGQSPLYYAVAKKNIRLVSLLLRAGAD